MKAAREWHVVELQGERIWCGWATGESQAVKYALETLPENTWGKVARIGLQIRVVETELWQPRPASCMFMQWSMQELEDCSTK